MTTPTRASILVVDDDSDILWTLSLLLRHEGYDVSRAANAAEALALIEAEPPDLIILDIRMPGMSGLELSARLRGRDDTRGIPIIIQSASPLDDPDGSGLYEVALRKPAEFDELLRTIAILLRGTRKAPGAEGRQRHA